MFTKGKNPGEEFPTWKYRCSAVAAVHDGIHFVTYHCGRATVFLRRFSMGQSGNVPLKNVG